jgi:hypothetical protein
LRPTPSRKYRSDFFSGFSRTCGKTEPRKKKSPLVFEK